MVRLHMKGDGPSVDGIFAGFWAGHYVIRQAKVVLAESRTETLDGDDLVVPVGNVEFMQRFRS